MGTSSGQNTLISPHTTSAAASLLSLYHLPTPTCIHSPHRPGWCLGCPPMAALYCGPQSPQGLGPTPICPMFGFFSPRFPCPSHVASVLKCTTLLPASGSLHMLFHLPGMLFLPPHPTPSYCLFNCFSVVRFHLLCHFLQEAYPDHPDAQAPQLCTHRSCPWCAIPHPLDPLIPAHQK